MTDASSAPKPARLPLPRDAFRSQRAGAAIEPVQPVVVTPAYGDPVVTTAPPPEAPSGALPRAADPTRLRVSRRPNISKSSDRDPFAAYGARSSSRPYTMRLPDPIDLVLRQIAAEQRAHPLRVLDRILYDHLARIGRLPAE